MYSEIEYPDGKGRQRNGLPEFYAMLEEMAQTHDKKNHDYASQDDPAGNYHYAGEMANMFSHSAHDAGFAGRLAEKIYRVANIEGSGKTVKNESIEDTERDIAVIAVMWMADRRRRRANQYNDGVMWSKGVPEKVTLNPTHTGAFDNIIKEGASCPAPPKDATDDVSTFNLLLNISRMINEYLSKLEIRS